MLVTRNSAKGHIKVINFRTYALGVQSEIKWNFAAQNHQAKFRYASLCTPDLVNCVSHKFNEKLGESGESGIFHLSRLLKKLDIAVN